jgi:hypothetical protein
MESTTSDYNLEHVSEKEMTVLQDTQRNLERVLNKLI